MHMREGLQPHWPVCLMARWETRNSSLDVEYLQKSHLKGRSLVWESWWLSSSFLFSQVYSQNSHLNLVHTKEKNSQNSQYWRCMGLRHSSMLSTECLVLTCCLPDSGCGSVGAFWKCTVSWRICHTVKTVTREHIMHGHFSLKALFRR